VNNGIQSRTYKLKKDDVYVLVINTKDHAPFDKLLEIMDYNLAERL